MSKLSELKEGIRLHNREYNKSCFQAIEEVSSALFIRLSDAIDNVLDRDPAEVAETQRATTLSELTRYKHPIAAEVKPSGLYISVSLPNLDIYADDAQRRLCNNPRLMAMVIPMTIDALEQHYLEYTIRVVEHHDGELLICVNDHEPNELTEFPIHSFLGVFKKIKDWLWP